MLNNKLSIIVRNRRTYCNFAKNPKFFGVKEKVSPEPKKSFLGLIGVICTVSIGLLIGATISKTVAGFLEENDLFIPSEDEDDD